MLRKVPCLNGKVDVSTPATAHFEEVATAKPQGTKKGADCAAPSIILAASMLPGVTTRERDAGYSPARWNPAYCSLPTKPKFATLDPVMTFITRFATS
jgi:hypothetical protein